MQVRIRRPSPHDVGACRLVRGRQAGGLGIEWPHNHPVRADRDGLAGRIVRIGITALRGSGQHINNAWFRVGGLRFASSEIGGPLHRRRICTQGRVANYSWISRHTGETIAAVTQDYSIAFRIGVNDSS